METLDALEAIEGAPVVVQSSEEFRVDRVGAAQSLFVFAGLGFGRELVRVFAVIFRERAARQVRFARVPRRFEKAAADVVNGTDRQPFPAQPD